MYDYLEDIRGRRAARLERAAIARQAVADDLEQKELNRKLAEELRVKKNVGLYQKLSQFDNFLLENYNRIGVAFGWEGVIELKLIEQASARLLMKMFYASVDKYMVYTYHPVGFVLQTFEYNDIEDVLMKVVEVISEC